MDFNGPGTSLFQGGDLSTFDNNAQREEEEEALEEQRLRNIELKNVLESAFNDLSFENEDCSGINMNFNNSNSNCNSKSPSTPSEGVFSNSHGSLPDVAKSFTKEEVQEFQTPVRHSRNVRTKAIDFNNQYEADSFSDQFRIKQQNGSLHDIVDASGGGGDAGVSLHLNHCARSNSTGNHEPFQNHISPKSEVNVSLNKQYQNAEYNSIEQLQILYEVRVREVHNLTKLIDTMENKYEMEKTELKRQLAFAVAENERHKISQSDLQSILVQSKTEIDTLKVEIDSLKKMINELEESRENLVIELETSRATGNDLERKLLAIEKGRKDITVQMQYETSIQELKEKHSLTVKNISEELDRCKINLETTNKENSELKHRLIQMSQVSDENLAKKSEIISRLSKQIEETQEQCEKLMKNSLSEDNIKLQMEVKILKEENEALASKVETLERNLTNQEMELKQYECLSNFSAFDLKQSSDLSVDKESDYTEINKKLREELFRALNSQKARRQEIQALQALIMKKDEQIHDMTEKERMFLVEAAKFREDIGKHIAELKKYESLTAIKDNENKVLKDSLNSVKQELERSVKDGAKKCRESEEEKKSLKDELSTIKKELEKVKLESVSKYNEEYMKFHNEGLQRVREEVQESLKLELLGKDIEIENLKREVEEVKNLYVEVYNEKENLLNQMEKEKTANRSIVDVDEVKKLQKELEKSRQRILELDLTLRQQYQQEVEKLNATIRSLHFELEKLKKEKDHDVSEKSKLATENQLLKVEMEQITAEKNLYFLNCETLRTEIDQLKRDVNVLRDTTEHAKTVSTEEHSREVQDIRSRYEIKIQKLNKEIELMLSRSVSTESKFTSPMKSTTKCLRHVASQRSPVPVQSASTSPLYRSSTQETCTSPIHDLRRDAKISPCRGSNRDVSVLTDPEPKNLTKREVVRMMEKLGIEHEEEMNLLENKYKLELLKLDKRWQSEVDTIREKIRTEMMNLHVEELEELQEKHKIEMENRIEQEKKEAVVALITEWACEVQSLKQSHAEALAEVDRMKMKYKTAKNVAIRYKTYFTSKAERMKEEWRKMEEGYENALKELEKNVHMLVDVREDEVRDKIQSITKVYEHKINKMRNKLEKYEELLRGEAKPDGEGVASSKNSVDERKSRSSDFGSPDRLVVPDTRLCRKKSDAPRSSDGERRTCEQNQAKKPLVGSKGTGGVHKKSKSEPGK